MVNYITLAIRLLGGRLGSSQATSDSNATNRQQIQIDDIASSDPRLVENNPTGASA